MALLVELILAELILLVGLLSAAVLIIWCLEVGMIAMAAMSY